MSAAAQVLVAADRLRDAALLLNRDGNAEVYDQLTKLASVVCSTLDALPGRSVRAENDEDRARHYRSEKIGAALDRIYSALEGDK